MSFCAERKRNQQNLEKFFQFYKNIKTNSRGIGTLKIIKVVAL